MTQPPLFGDGRGGRDDGMERAARGAGDDWLDRAIETVYQVALQKPLFATDDIWAAGLEPPEEPRAMGPVMARAVKEGLCERTETTRISRMARQHARPIRVYRSKVAS